MKKLLQGIVNLSVSTITWIIGKLLGLPVSNLNPAEKGIGHKHPQRIRGVKTNNYVKNIGFYPSNDIQNKIGKMLFGSYHYSLGTKGGLRSGNPADRNQASPRPNF